MSWGYKIVLAYVGFVVILVIMAYHSFNTKVDLVAPDYYKQELAYQERIEEISNERELEHSIDIKMDAQKGLITLVFPDEMTNSKGQIRLYRPSNAQWDQQWTIGLDQQGKQQLNINELPKGRWNLQVQWEAAGQPFYKQKTLYLP